MWVHHRAESIVLDSPTNPAHLGRHAHNLGRLHPRQLPGDCLGEHFPPGPGSCLTPHPPLDVLPLADSADIFKYLYPGHLQCL
jgi:hypothetical protein